MERDPLWVLSLSLPAGWALDPYSSALHKLVFFDWSRPLERQLHAMVEASHAGAHEDDATWEVRVRAALPPDVLRVERREGAVLWVERAGRERRPDQRWAFVRGPRFDAVLEQVGVPVGGALATPELEQAVRTLDVAINRYLGERFPQERLRAHMLAAHAARQRQDGAVALRELEAALHVARATWLHSLVNAPLPDVGAALAMAEAMLRLSIVTSSTAFLREAGLVLLRCRASLQQMPVPCAPALQQQAEGLLAECRTHLAKLAGEPPAGNEFSELLMRSKAIAHEAMALIRHSPRAARSPAADKAVQDAMSAAALAARGIVRKLSAEHAALLVKRGVVDPAEQLAAANQQLRVFALQQLVAAGVLYASGRAQANSTQERTRCANVLLAARELAEISPGPESEVGVALALNLLAAALMGLGDEASLQEVETLLNEAGERMQALAGHAELRAQILFSQAWLQYYQRCAEEGLATVDRALDAAWAAKSERLVRAARSLRGSFLGIAGRFDEAKAEAQAALDSTYDDAASTHFLNLAVVLHGAGDIDGAAQALRDGLAAAIADQPLAPEVVRLLFVAADCLGAADAAAARAATETAQTVLDALRIGLNDAQDLIGFDDAAHHRLLAGSLVQRQLDAGDPLAALASADRHRARELLQQLNFRRRAPARPLPRSELPAEPPADAPLAAQIAFIDAAARNVLNTAGEPVARDGASLADLVARHGRMALVCHPSGDELILFLVLPEAGRVSIVCAQASLPLPQLLDLTERLRAQLGIVVAARSARGLAPPQSVADLDAALADDAELAPVDQCVDQLLQAVHEALLAPLLPHMTAGRPLVVLPYRELSVVPLSLLRDGQGRALVERHDLSVLPSLTTLETLAPVGAPAAHAVVVGDPLLDAGSGLPPLPGAAAEALAVGAMLKAAGIETRLLMHGDATEQAFRAAARGARIVHLACHAASRARASESPLFLAPQPPDDGLMLPADIADLRLDGALVVLAACQSGLGRATADGVLGLGRAFLQAGARCVLLSLWRVSDAATRELMTHFYAGLVGSAGSPALDAAAALGSAQRAGRAAFGDAAALWGPWLLVGDGGWRLRL